MNMPKFPSNARTRPTDYCGRYLETQRAIRLVMTTAVGGTAQ